MMQNGKELVTDMISQAGYKRAKAPGKPKALVVDNDRQFREDIEDTLFSVGHDYDLVTNYHDARQMLNQQEYSYVLLSLKIPARPRRGQPKSEFCMLLLEDICRTNGPGRVPVIVMMDHDSVSVELIGELVSCGASGFTPKPFPRTGQTLARVVRRAAKNGNRLAKANGHQSYRPSAPASPRRFPGGEMVFCDTRVELCDVKICGAEGSCIIRQVLDILRNTDAQGRHRSFSGEELAAIVGTDGGPTAVAGAIRNFRNRVKRTLLAEANVDIDPSTDVIVNDRQHGYRFSNKITVMERPGLLTTNQGEVHTDGVSKQRKGPPLSDTLPSETDDDARARWILAQLKKNGGIRKQQIIQRTGCSDSTARRTLARLRDDGKIVFEGSARNGYWRMDTRPDGLRHA